MNRSIRSLGLVLAAAATLVACGDGPTQHKAVGPFEAPNDPKPVTDVVSPAQAVLNGFSNALQTAMDEVALQPAETWDSEGVWKRVDRTAEAFLADYTKVTGLTLDPVRGDLDRIIATFKNDYLAAGNGLGDPREAKRNAVRVLNESLAGLIF
jgi:hypothetical protein